MKRVYTEHEVTDGSDVDFVLNLVPGTVRKVVVLVWFDADSTPTPQEMGRLCADHWEVHDVVEPGTCGCG